MYADFTRKLQKELSDDIMEISTPEIDLDEEILKSSIHVLGVTNPIILIIYNFLTKEYRVTDSVKKEISEFSSENESDTIEYIKDILKEPKLLKLIEEIKLLLKYGKI